jgi:hypothetical protein
MQERADIDGYVDLISGKLLGRTLTIGSYDNRPLPY